MRILQVNHPQEIKRIMQEIQVDPYGISIMLPKAITHLIRVNAVTNIAANILKQELLSVGADAALSRGSLTGKDKKTDCLLMGTPAQFLRVCEKLSKQPFGLALFSRELATLLKNYQKEKFTMKLGRYTLYLGKRTHIMGIVNLTPDSFSGDGLLPPQAASCLQSGRHNRLQGIVGYAQKLVAEGADIIDVGGESSRPGARPISAKEEIKRTLPAIQALTKKIKIPVSIDTYKPQVAMAALDNGAVLVNDIAGLRDKKMAKTVARYKAGAVIMHMQGTPFTMQKKPHYGCLIEEIIEFLRKSLLNAEEAGVCGDKIAIDPGIGFGKSQENNLEIVHRLKEFKVLGKPLLVGPSRKSFLGRILKTGAQDRVFGTVAASVSAAINGAHIIRAHDVLAARQALKVTDAIRNYSA